MATDANSQAFPKGQYAKEGLTKREYFAAQALNGLCANAGNNSEDDIRLSVELADKLIAKLNESA